MHLHTWLRIVYTCTNRYRYRYAEYGQSAAHSDTCGEKISSRRVKSPARLEMLIAVNDSVAVKGVIFMGGRGPRRPEKH